MTLCKTSQEVKSITGTIGGCYFHSDNTGLHCSTLPLRKKNSTTAQKKTRYIFSLCIQKYTSHAWTPQELKKWHDFARRHPRKNRLNASQYLTSQNIFVGYNAVRLRNNLPILYSPPVDE